MLDVCYYKKNVGDYYNSVQKVKVKLICWFDFSVQRAQIICVVIRFSRHLINLVWIGNKVFEIREPIVLTPNTLQHLTPNKISNRINTVDWI